MNRDRYHDDRDRFEGRYHRQGGAMSYPYDEGRGALAQRRSDYGSRAFAPGEESWFAEGDRGEYREWWVDFQSPSPAPHHDHANYYGSGFLGGYGGGGYYGGAESRGYGVGGSQGLGSAGANSSPGGWGGGMGAYGGTHGHGARGVAPQERRWPMNYARVDTRVYEDVCDAIGDQDLDASAVEVRVEDGVVTLTGAVDDRATQRRIEDVAEHVRGVREVHNQIRVRRRDDRASS